MIIYLIYKSPLWHELEASDRDVRILILGVICYVLFHSLMFSKYGDDVEILQKIRKNLIYFFGLDTVLIGTVLYKRYNNPIQNTVEQPKLQDQQPNDLLKYDKITNMLLEMQNKNSNQYHSNLITHENKQLSENNEETINNTMMNNNVQEEESIFIPTYEGIPVYKSNS